MMSRIGKYESPLALLGERFSLSRELRRIVSAERIDLVESYDWSGPLWTRPAVSMVVRLHGANCAHAHFEKRKGSRFLRFVERRNVRMADRVIAVSRHVGETTQAALGERRFPFSVVYNGVDTSVFKPTMEKRELAEVLYVGSLSRRKGLFELFQAIPLVLRQVAGARFTLVGNDQVDETGKRFSESLLDTLPDSARKSVRFMGARPHAELPAFYRRATVAVFPSLAEAFGLTCAEAMACGCSVVMTSRASGPELVEHGVSGILAEPTDEKALSDAIVTLLRDSDIRQKMGRQARARVEKLFSLETLVDRTLSEYEQAIIDSRNQR